MLSPRAGCFALLVLLAGCDRPASPPTLDEAQAPADAGRAGPRLPPLPSPGDDGGTRPPTNADPAWRAGFLYLAMPDRFFNGDPSNDAAGDTRCFDLEDPLKFQGGDLAGLTQKVPYLAELGASAVWVTPVLRQIDLHYDACGYHGYWADLADPDDFALEPKLGDAAAFDLLARTLHERKMGLLLDMVANHVGYGARLVRSHPDWFHPSEGCASRGDPDLSCPLASLPDLAHENPDVARYVTAHAVAWVSRFELDGIRMDTAKHVSPSYFRQDWVPAVAAARPGMFLLAEAFLEGGARDLQPYLDMGFDSAFHFPLRRRLLNTFGRNGSFDPLADEVVRSVEELGLERAARLVTFLDNHDVPRFLSESAEATPDDLRQRYHLALTALFTLPGIPQLYQGDELGQLGGYPQNRRRLPDWTWTEAGRAADHAGYLPQPQRTFAYVQKLARLRRENPALWSGSYVELWRQRTVGPNVWAYFRGKGNNRVVVVFNNGLVPSGPLRVPVQTNGGLPAEDRAALPDGTRWTELLGEGGLASATSADGALTIELGAKRVAIYRAE